MNAVVNDLTTGPSTSRIRWIDAAKGIGIALVVYGHVVRGLHDAGLKMNEEIYRTVDSVIYSFHMPLFFILSGWFFLGSLQRRGARGVAADKSRTLLYPFVVWSVLQGAVELVLSRWTNKHASFSDVASFLWAPRMQFWFLWALFIICMIAIVLYGQGHKTRWTSASLLGVVLASAVLFGMREVTEIRQIRYIETNLVYFCFGIFCHSIEAWARRHIAVVAAVSLAVAVAAEWFVHSTGIAYPEIPLLIELPLALVASVAVIAVCVLLERFGSRSFDAFVVLGRSSMQIFLAHVLAASGVRMLLMRGLHIDGFALNVVFGCAGGMLFPFMLSRYADRFGLSWLFSMPKPTFGSKQGMSSIRQAAGGPAAKGPLPDRTKPG